jgi:hypothetical protein
MSKTLIGTSGWPYASWRCPFFPKNVMVKHHLEYYATQFSTTELNAVFYRTPTVEAVRGWRDDTPDDFEFTWKASNSLRTGNAPPVSRVTALHYSIAIAHSWAKSRAGLVERKQVSALAFGRCAVHVASCRNSSRCVSTIPNHSRQLHAT